MTSFAPGAAHATHQNGVIQSPVDSQQHQPFPQPSQPLPQQLPQQITPPSVAVNPTAPQSQSQSQSQAQSQAQSQSQSQPQSQLSQHKRVYQACIPCRRRKVRCDLGSVDNPHDPPCVRCRRESKECFFSATRRKRKNEDGEDDEDEYLVRNSRKRHYLDTTSPVPVDRKVYNSVPLTPGSTGGRNQSQKRSSLERGEDGRKSSRGTSYTEGAEDSNAQLENLEAQSVMRKSVFGPHDALDLLYKAATDRSVISVSPPNPDQGHAADYAISPHEPHVRHGRTVSVVQPTPVSAPGRKSPHDRNPNFNDRFPSHPEPRSVDPIDPRLLPSRDVFDPEKETREIEAKLRSVEDELGYQDALEAWSRFRFVRAGWFTNQEAVRYVV